jgi:hypothetical protein
MDKVPNEILANAAIDLMEATGRPMRKLATGTRAMKYALDDGQTVRIRTCNDHVLVVLASSAEESASLNIEGTDFLLVVMPKTARQAGPVVAYLLPVAVAVEDVRRAHAAWLRSGPATKGGNRTWNIWFGDGHPSCSGFSTRWARYKLSSPSITSHPPKANPTQRIEEGSLGAVIAKARRDIAIAAGVTVEAVKISVELA